MESSRIQTSELIGERGSYLLLEAQSGILFAVQFPQRVFIALVPSSNIVVQWDIQTCIPHSAQAATACPLQTEHLAIEFTPFGQRAHEGPASIIPG
jgi:hypothetical protein